VNACRETSRAGFTLLELLAVLLIGGLLMGLMIPNLSPLKTRVIREHAARIVAMADLGRQRAVVTGIPHRLVINLDNASYALEWTGKPAESTADETAENSELDLFGDPNGALEPFKKAISLKAPKQTEQTFAPLPGLLGRVESLRGGIEFAEIETTAGLVETDSTFVRFESDGTASFTKIVLDDQDGRQLILVIPTLADTVRIFDEGL
jgi:prepilin-type N-terminal cleavage/methylation domain-containing protein